MRYSAAEELEIIQLVGQSNLPQRRCLASLGIPRQTFYRWYDRYLTGGPEALADKPSRPDRVWNRIPDAVQARIIDLALEVPELSPRELAVRFTDQESYFVSEASVYRLLKSRDLLPSPAFIQIKAAEEFHTKTTAPNQLWQTDFTYLKVIGWGWFYLCTVLDDFLDGKAGQLNHGRAAVEHVQIEVEHPDHVGDVFGEQTVDQGAVAVKFVNLVLMSRQHADHRFARSAQPGDGRAPVPGRRRGRQAVLQLGR